MGEFVGRAQSCEQALPWCPASCAQTETIGEMGKAVQTGLAQFWDANRLQTVVAALIQQHLPLTEKELQVSFNTAISDNISMVAYCTVLISVLALAHDIPCSTGFQLSLRVRASSLTSCHVIGTPGRMLQAEPCADMLQLWEEDAEHFAHVMGTDDPFRSKAEALLLTLLEVTCCPYTMFGGSLQASKSTHAQE